MIGNDTFVSAFGLVPAGGDEALIAIVSNAVRSGFAVVLNRPGEKRPVCILSERDRNAADRKAREEAAAIGDPRFALRKHDCGLSHALTVASLTGTEENPEGDPSKVRAKVGTIIRRIEKKFGAKPNIGVEVGLSRVLVVDVDTDREKAGFIADWEAANAGPVPGMTVMSPGKTNEAGEWVHKNGGHYWFTIPDGVELPAGQGVFKAESGWAAMWNGHQVLVPPSSRTEGEYHIIGQIQEAAPFLITKLIEEAEARINRAKTKGALPDGTGDIDAYFANVPWTDLLTDWEDTGLIDRCSCPIFTAPGAHSSPKSATAHDAGCNRPEYDRAMGHWPIHVWTDNGPEWLQEAIRRSGNRTFTKMQWLAWRDHDGANRAVLNELGLNASDSVFGAVGAAEEFSPLDEAIRERAERPEKPSLSAVPADVDPFMDAEAGEASEDDSEASGDDDEEDDEPAEPELSRAEQIRAQFLRPSQLDQIPKLEPLIEGFFDLNTVARVTGKSGDGKSFVMLDMALHVACGISWHGKEVTQGAVFYMVAEGAEGFVKRVRSWEKFYGITVPDENFMILPFPIQSSSDDWGELAKALKPDEPVMCIFDTQARITVGVKENDATDMGLFVDKLEKMRRYTKACVITVHHTGHEGDHGRGSTAVIGALSAEVRVKKTKKGHLTVESEKQKDAAEFDPLKFRLESIQVGENPDPQRDSAVVIPDGWAPADEFEPGDTFTDAGPAIVGGVDEDSSTRDRLAAILWRYFSHGDGATPAELKSTAVMGVPEFGKMSSASAKRSWNDLIAIGAVERVVDGNTGKLTSRYKLKADYARALGLSMVWDLPAYPTAAPVGSGDGSDGSDDAPAGEEPDDDDGDAQASNQGS